MANDTPPEPQVELPKHFVVRLVKGEHVRYVVCEAIVSFDESNLFPVGARALQDIFREFHDATVAEVAVLPPLSDPKWKQVGATAQLAGPGDDGGP